MIDGHTTTIGEIVKPKLSGMLLTAGSNEELIEGEEV
jgi:hypothetical protein